MRLPLAAAALPPLLLLGGLEGRRTTSGFWLGRLTTTNALLAGVPLVAAG